MAPQKFQIESLTLKDHQQEVIAFYQGVLDSLKTTIDKTNWSMTKAAAKLANTTLFSDGNGTMFAVGLSDGTVSNEFALAEPMKTKISDVIKFVVVYPSNGTALYDAVIPTTAYQLSDIEHLCMSNGLITLNYDFSQHQAKLEPTLS